MYTVSNNTAQKIDLQAYIEEEALEVEGAVGFNPMDASTPKYAENQNKPQSQSSRPSDLRTIDEHTEASSKLSRRENLVNIKNNLKKPPPFCQWVNLHKKLLKRM